MKAEIVESFTLRCEKAEVKQKTISSVKMGLNMRTGFIFCKDMD